MSFLCRVGRLNVRDRVKSSVILGELGVEPLLLFIKRSRMRWFFYSIWLGSPLANLLICANVSWKLFKHIPEKKPQGLGRRLRWRGFTEHIEVWLSFFYGTPNWSKINKFGVPYSLTPSCKHSERAIYVFINHLLFLTHKLVQHCRFSFPCFTSTCERAGINQTLD